MSSEKSAPRRVELPVLCKFLRCKSAFGAIEDNEEWQLGTSTVEVYWCLATMEAFGPAFDRRKQLAEDPDTVRDILKEGASKAREKAQEVLQRARAACGLGGR